MEKIAICRFYLLNKFILNILKTLLVVYMGVENKDEKETRALSDKGGDFRADDQEDSVSYELSEISL